MKKQVIGCAAALMLSSHVQSAPIVTDIVSVIDESGSMSGEQAWLGSFIGQLNTALLQVAGNDVFDPRYGLVGYGDRNITGRSITMADGDLWGDANEFNQATNQLVASGGFEDGYEAMQFTFDNYAFRSNASKHVFLITDEDRDVYDINITYNSIFSEFSSMDTMLTSIVNATFQCADGRFASGITQGSTGIILDSVNNSFSECQGATTVTGFGSTIDDYVNLSLATGGSVWNINDFRRGTQAVVDSFTAALVNTTVDAIREDANEVNAPGTLGLLGLVLMGLFRRGRTK